jgi:hypothetical protein
MSIRVAITVTPRGSWTEEDILTAMCEWMPGKEIAHKNGPAYRIDYVQPLPEPGASVDPANIPKPPARKPRPAPGA